MKVITINGTALVDLRKGIPLDPAKLKGYNLATIAKIIARDWTYEKIYFGAKPYLDALETLDGMDDTYGLDDAETIVAYLVSNLSTYRGDTARKVKAELKARLKAHR